MSGFQYDPHAFDLMHELFSRQQSHLQAILGYLGAHCQAGEAFAGILAPLAGHYSAAYHDAQEGLQHGAAIAEHCASKISESKQQVLADDKAAYDRMAALAAKAGHPLPPWHAPDTGSGALGEGEGVEEGGGDSPLKQLVEGTTTTRAQLEQGSQTASWLLSDPIDPLKPGELTPDQWSDPHTVIKHLLQERLYERQQHGYELQAQSDPGGHGADYFRQQDLLHNQLRFEDGFGSGQSYAQEHLHTSAGSGPLHNSPWLSEDGRETLRSGAEIPAKAINIVGALPATVAAGVHVHEALDTAGELSRTAAGPANTGSYDWAEHDKTGREW